MIREACQRENLSSAADPGFDDRTSSRMDGEDQLGLWKYLEEQLGVEIEFVHLSAEDYATGLSSGNLPDIVATDNNLATILDNGVALNAEQLISESNSGSVFENEDGQSVCTFSMTMESPDWTLVREVSMENHEQVVSRVRLTVVIVAGVVFLIALAIYHLWLKKFMRQFNTLLGGITRMGEGELEPSPRILSRSGSLKRCTRRSTGPASR